MHAIVREWTASCRARSSRTRPDLEKFWRPSLERRGIRDGAQGEHEPSSPVSTNNIPRRRSISSHAHANPVTTKSPSVVRTGDCAHLRRKLKTHATGLLLSSGTGVRKVPSREATTHTLNAAIAPAAADAPNASASKPSEQRHQNRTHESADHPQHEFVPCRRDRWRRRRSLRRLPRLPRQSESRQKRDLACRVGEVRRGCRERAGTRFAAARSPATFSWLMARNRSGLRKRHSLGLCTGAPHPAGPRRARRPGGSPGT